MIRQDTNQFLSVDCSNNISILHLGQDITSILHPRCGGLTGILPRPLASGNHRIIQHCLCDTQVHTQGTTKGLLSPKLREMDTMNDAEYVANLVNVNTWLHTCNSAFIAWVCYTCITTFFLLYHRPYRLKFSLIYTPQIKLWVCHW